MSNLLNYFQYKMFFEDEPMSIHHNPPPQWATFVNLSRQNMPDLPSMGEPPAAEARRRIGRVLNVVTTLLGGAGINLPTQLDHLTNLGLADAVDGAAQSTAQTLALQRLGASGGIVGGGVEILRGGHQQLSRGHDMIEYVLGMCGYVTTFAVMSLTAVMANRHDTPYPNPPIPIDMMQAGDLFTARRQAHYRAGVDRAWRVVTRLDNIRPADRTRDHYSKGCLSHIAINTGNTRVDARYSLLMRKSCESLIASELLKNDLQAQREQLRQWCRSS
jgi:hypothetical protein